MINISSHLKKEYWKRRVAGDMPTKPPTRSEFYIQPTNLGEPFRLLTQTDFMREIESSAHDINSKYMSTRPIKEVREKKNPDGTTMCDKNGKPVKEWCIVDYDQMETTRYGFQNRFALTKAAHFAGDGWGIYNEQTDTSKEAHDRFDNLASWKDVAGLDIAFMEVAKSCFMTGDAALYLYATPTGSLDYKVYSFLDGYQIFPDIDENGNKVYYVLYSLKGKNTVDVFASSYIDTWVQADISGENEDENTNSWWNKVKGLFKSADSTVSSDGWRRVAHKETQVQNGINQLVYFRVNDIPSGCVQDDIESMERSASFVSEGMKNSVFDTLFIKAADIISLPPFGSHGKTIGVKGSVEELKASDAKRLQPGDISNVATIDLKEKRESILNSSLSVIVSPELLRSGADSSSAMRLCFNDEVKWCMTMQPTFYKPLKELVELLKALVAKIEKDGEYTKIRTSIAINIWVPSNFSETVENTCKLKYASILSAENARHEVDINYPDDISIIRKEAEAELYRQTYIPLQAKYEAQKRFGLTDVADDVVVSSTDDNNPYKPGVTNQATSK